MLQSVLWTDILLLAFYLISKQYVYLSPVVGSGIAIAASLVFILKQHEHQNRRFFCLEQKTSEDMVRHQKDMGNQQHDQTDQNKKFQTLQDKHTEMKKLHVSLQSLEKLQQDNKDMNTELHQQINNLDKEQQKCQDAHKEGLKNDEKMQTEIQEKIKTLESQLQEQNDIVQKKQTEHQGVYTKVEKQGQELCMQIQKQITTLQKMEKQQQGIDKETQQQIGDLKDKEKENHDAAMKMRKQHDDTTKQIQKEHQDAHAQIQKEIELVQQKHNNVINTNTEFQKQVEDLQKKQREQENILKQIQEQQDKNSQIQEQQKNAHTQTQKQIDTFLKRYTEIQEQIHKQYNTLQEMQEKLGKLGVEQMRHQVLQQQLENRLNDQEQEQYKFQSLIDKQIQLDQKVEKNKKKRVELEELGHKLADAIRSSLIGNQINCDQRVEEKKKYTELEKLSHSLTDAIRSSGLIPESPKNGSSSDLTSKDLVKPFNLELQMLQKIDVGQSPQSNKKEYSQELLKDAMSPSNIISKGTKNTPNGGFFLTTPPPNLQKINPEKMKSPSKFPLQSWATVEKFDFSKCSAYLAQSFQSLSHVGIHGGSLSSHIYKTWESFFSDEEFGERARKAVGHSERCDEESSLIPGTVDQEDFEDFRSQYETMMPTGDGNDGLPEDVIVKDDDEVDFWSFVWYMTRMEAVTKGAQVKELTNKDLYNLLPLIGKKNNSDKPPTN